MAWLLTLGTVPLQQLWQERWSTLSVRSDACSPPHQEHGAWPGACGKCSDITEAQAHERGVCQCPSGDVSADPPQTSAIPTGFWPLQTSPALAGEMLSAEVMLAQPQAVPRAERCPEHPMSRAACLGHGDSFTVLNGFFLLQDLEKESDTPLQQVSIEEILEEQRVEQQAKQESEKLKVQALKERGLSVPRADTLDEY